jgi:nicotinate-nucleotide adenylyltransferase
LSLGILGGTFDPIHLGHLRAAESAREALGLERVLFVPSAQPPHRPAPRASALDRYAMVALATAGRSEFVPCDLELERGGPSYSVDTLLELRDREPRQALVLILGSDALADLPAWREVGRIFSLARVAIVARPGAAAVTGPLPGDVERVAGAGLDVSSSAIRAHLAAGSSVHYLVPPAVAGYIAKRGLYA